jgi:hypothetical protein
MRRTRAKSTTSPAAALAPRIIVAGAMPEEWKEKFAARLAADVLEQIEGKPKPPNADPQT